MLPSRVYQRQLYSVSWSHVLLHHKLLSMSRFLKDLFTKLKPFVTVSGSNSTKFIGTDEAGNRFFEKAFAGSGSLRKTKRYFEPPTRFGEFDKPVSPEWSAWLQYRREDPPISGHNASNDSNANMNKEQADEISRKFKQTSDEPSSCSSNKNEKWPKRYT